MAFIHGKDVSVTVGTTTLDGEIVDANLDMRKALADLSLIGTDAVQRVAGLEDATMTINGPADSTTLEALLAYWRAGNPITVTYVADTTTLSFSALIESITISASGTDTVRFTMNISATGQVSIA
jgi:hypothetical protein